MFDKIKFQYIVKKGFNHFNEKDLKFFIDTKIQKAIAIYKKLWYNNQGKALIYWTFQNAIKHYKTAFLFLKEIITNRQKALYLLDFRAFTGFSFCFDRAKNQQKIKNYEIWFAINALMCYNKCRLWSNFWRDGYIKWQLKCASFIGPTRLRSRLWQTNWNKNLISRSTR